MENSNNSLETSMDYPDQGIVSRAYGVDVLNEEEDIIKRQIVVIFFY